MVSTHTDFLNIMLIMVSTQTDFLNIMLKHILFPVAIISDLI